MDRKILDDQIKLFKEKESEIYAELKKLDQMEIDFIEESENPENYEFKCMGKPPNKIDMIYLYYILLECQNQNWNNNLIFR